MSYLVKKGRFAHVLDLAGGSSNEVWDTLLVETKNFVAVPSKGSLVPGWAMIVPRRHVFSFRHLTPAEMDEAKLFVQSVCRTLVRCYGQVTIFEHGAAYSGSALGCGVDHAHLHVVPLFTDIFPHALADRSLCWRTMTSWTDLHRYVSEGQEYLLMTREDGHAYVATQIPSTSQYFRKLISELLGRQSQWDYRAFPFEENARMTVRSFMNPI